jgi:hypothetical protein
MKQSRRTPWLLALLLAMPFVLQRLLAAAPDFTEMVLARRLFPILSAPLRTLSSLTPFSLTELIVVSLPVWLAVLIFAGIHAGRQGRLKAWARQAGLRFLWILAIAAWLFMLLHGFNYARQPVAQSFDLPVRQRSADEVAEMTLWVAEQAATARLGCLLDDNGVFRLQQNQAETLALASIGYDAASAHWPLLKGARARPKGVLLSHYWSYTGISGLYMPLLVEANVNVDQPGHAIPATVNHELAHTIGFAREDEAGFVGFLAGVANPSPDYVYSTYADALVHLLNSLVRVDPARYQAVTREIPETLWRDLAAAHDYWQTFEGPVRETSTQVNDAFLKSNLQADGVYSYGRMVDLLLAWYEQQVR